MAGRVVFLVMVVLAFASGWASAAAPSVSDATGWSLLEAPPDARRVYVSSSRGRDANSGLSPSQPVRTLAAGRALLRDGEGDWLLLKRGDVWEESLDGWALSGRSAEAPMVITGYGIGTERPVVRAPEGHAFSRDDRGPAEVSNLAIVGLRFEAHPSGAGASGLWWTGGGSGLLIEDCVFSGGSNGVVIQGGERRVRDVRVRRCLVLDVGGKFGNAHGLYAWGVDGLVVEGCVFDHADPGDDPLRRHLHAGSDNTGVVVRENIFARASGEGALLACGGVVESNVFAMCPRGVTLGGGAYDPLTHTLGVTGIVRGNVVMDGGEGIVAMNIRTPRSGRGALVEGNIVARASGVGIRLGGDSEEAGVGVGALEARGNVVYACAVGIRLGDGVGESVRVVGNQVVAASGEGVLIETSGGEAELEANLYGEGMNVARGEACGARTWARMMGEADGVWGAPAYAEPGRSLGSMNLARGGGATSEAYLGALRARGAGEWSGDLDAPSLIEHVRAGFAISTEARVMAPTP